MPGPTPPGYGYDAGRVWANRNGDDRIGGPGTLVPGRAPMTRFGSGRLDLPSGVVYDITRRTMTIRESPVTRSLRVGVPIAMIVIAGFVGWIFLQGFPSFPGNELPIPGHEPPIQVELIAGGLVVFAVVFALVARHAGRNTWWSFGPEGMTIHRPGKHVELPWERISALRLRQEWRTRGVGYDNNSYQVFWVDVVTEEDGAVPAPEEPTEGRLRRILRHATELEVVPSRVRIEAGPDG